jgi:hypothetical protein
VERSGAPDSPTRSKAQGHALNLTTAIAYGYTEAVSRMENAVMMTRTSILSPLPLVAVFLFVAPASVVLADCDTHEAQAGWQALLERHPSDMHLRALYDLRLRLCEQIERGTIDQDEASERFERARARLLEKWRQENERREQKETLTA